MLSKTPLTPAAAPEGKRGDHVDWRERAACAGLPLNLADEMFNPVQVAKQKDSPGMEYCWQRCPVRTECLDDAIETEPNNGIHGIRGGYTEEERRTMYRKAARDRHAAKAKAAVEVKA